MTSSEASRPATERALRNRVWASLGLVILGLGVGLFAVLAMQEFIGNCDGVPKGECDEPTSGFPALIFVVPALALWEGLVVLPREVRLLRRPGQRMVLTPHFALERKTTMVLGLWPASETVASSWLVAEEGGARLAIPVSEGDAYRCRPEIAALVRGRLRPSSHVMIDFPEEIIVPTGAVRVLPVGATTDPEPTSEPQLRHLLAWQFRWRMAVAGVVIFAAVSLLFAEVHSGTRSCGTVPAAFWDRTSANCTQNALWQTVACLAVVALGIRLVVTTYRRRTPRWQP